MEKIVTHLQQLWPWLGRCEIVFDGAALPMRVPAWLGCGCAAFGATQEAALALMFPWKGQAARMIAIMFALERFRQTFADRARAVACRDLQPNESVVLSPDNRVFKFDGWGNNGSVKLKLSNGDSVTINRFNPLRLRRGIHGPAGTLKISMSPTSHGIAVVLDSDPLGNPAIFRNDVVLLDTLSKFKDLCGSLEIRPLSDASNLSCRLWDFAPLGALKSPMDPAFETSFDLWNKPAGQPLIAITHSLDDLHRHARRAPLRSVWIVVNGAARIIGDHTKLAEIAERQNLLLVSDLAENKAIAEIAKIIDVWALDEEPWIFHTNDIELNALSATSFRSSHLHCRDWVPVPAHHATLQVAAENLGVFCMLQQDAEESPGQTLAGPAWRLLMEAANRTRRFQGNAASDFEERIAGFEKRVSEQRQWLSKEAEEALNAALRALRALLQEWTSSDHPKGGAIYTLVQAAARDQLSVALIARSETEATSLRDRFRERQLPVESFTTATFDVGDQTFGQVVACGWLGGAFMSRLFSTCPAPRLTLVGYPFERRWLRGLIARIDQRGGIAPIGPDERGKIAGIGTAWPDPQRPARVSWTEESSGSDTERETAVDAHGATGRWHGLDILDFELKLQGRRKDRKLSEADRTADCREVHYVSFHGDAYGYFDPGASRPVVTAVIASQSESVPYKSIEQWRPSDLIAFPKVTNRELIEELVDTKLGDRAVRLRIEARQYEHFLTDSRLSPEEFVRRARPLGFDKTPSTVHQWMAGARVLGPADASDLAIIGRVIPSFANLVQRNADAIAQLTSAHHEAGRWLRQTMIERLPNYLERIEEEGACIDLGDLGQVWVLCVESVAEQAEWQPPAKCNRVFGLD